MSFKKIKRDVHSIFLHCSASDQSSHDDISIMKKWHVEDNGWSDVGYHFFITKNGDIQEGRNIEKIPIAQKGHNTGSIAICCHGLKKDKFTQKQMDSVKALCKAITDAYTKKIRIRGHREVSSKECPVYDYKKVLGLDDKGYYSESEVLIGPMPAPKIEPPPFEFWKAPVRSGSKAKTIKLMDKNELVLPLQNILCDLDIQCSKDGVFGQQTKTAVQTFQKRSALSADGIVGPATIDSMFSSRRLVLKPSHKGTDVKVLQLLLAMHGRRLIHDGVFGQATRLALQAVQRSLQLAADGVFGPKSRAAMT
ncbi:N-acetylmuramoyl-L-alanine amidase [Exilibacterium tricleocarpae]|uniref:N-acetylmuramoyl-L-alanine amidase n=1 Tax=Exilibacterium tricleocarpae TaxID=2591008 RepID=A0A545TZV5_9GAMM|nr:N-acetylmuramoyl-L-alanine amidase [Exilibacterium tricleocarpae]